MLYLKTLIVICEVWIPSHDGKRPHVVSSMSLPHGVPFSLKCDDPEKPGSLWSH